MNRGYKREMRLAAVLLVLTMLLPLVRFPVNATQVGGTHVVDLDNILPEEEKAVLNQILFDHNSGNGYTEAVMVVESVEKDITAESSEFLISTVASMFGFGAMEGKQPGSLYLYINRRASGDLRLQVIATDRLKDYFTNYQIDYLNAELNRFAASQRDFKEILKFFLNLKSIYTYPVINEMGEESIPLDVVRKATEEIKAWRGKYQQAIVLLLNKRFGDGLYEKYREDYFMSQGYGEGKKRSGIFLIYDQSLNRFDVSFYGDTSRDFDRQQLDLLKNELLKHLNRLDILEVVYSIERFLTPEETIPMVPLLGTESTTNFSDSDMVLDYVGMLENGQELEEELRGYSQYYKEDALTYVMKGGDIREADLEGYVGELFAKHNKHKKGFITFFDVQNNRRMLYIAGDLLSYMKDRTKQFDPFAAWILRKLEQGRYTAESIQKHQVMFTDYLSFSKGRESGRRNIIDTHESLYGLIEDNKLDEISDKLANVESLGLTPMVILKKNMAPYAQPQDWLSDYEEGMAEAGHSKEMLVLGFGTKENDFALGYFGADLEIKRYVETTFRTELENAFHTGGLVMLLEKYEEIVSTKILGALMGTDDLKSDSQSKQPEVSKKQHSGNLPEVSKEEKRMDKTLLFIIIGVLVVLVIFVLIMILAGKNKKGSSAHPGNYPNQPNRGNYPNQGMPQNYSNPMQQGYQGYGNTPTAGVYGNQGMQQQPYAQAQGYQNQVGQGQSAYANPQSYSQPYGNQGTYSQPYNSMPSQNYQQAYNHQMPQGYPQTYGNQGLQAGQPGQSNYNPSPAQGYPQNDNPQSQSSMADYYNEGPQQKE